MLACYISLFWCILRLSAVFINMVTTDNENNKRRLTNEKYIKSVWNNSRLPNCNIDENYHIELSTKVHTRGSFWWHFIIGYLIYRYCLNPYCKHFVYFMEVHVKSLHMHILNQSINSQQLIPIHHHYIYPMLPRSASNLSTCGLWISIAVPQIFILRHDQ